MSFGEITPFHPTVFVPLAPAREEALPPAGLSCVPCTQDNDSKILLYSAVCCIFLIDSEEHLGNCSAMVLLVIVTASSTTIFSVLAKRTFSS